MKRGIGGLSHILHQNNDWHILRTGMYSKEAVNATGGFFRSFYGCFISAVETCPNWNPL